MELHEKKNWKGSMRVFDNSAKGKRCGLQQPMQSPAQIHGRLWIDAVVYSWRTIISYGTVRKYRYEILKLVLIG